MIVSTAKPAKGSNKAKGQSNNTGKPKPKTKPKPNHIPTAVRSSRKSAMSPVAADPEVSPEAPDTEDWQERAAARAQQGQAKRKREAGSSDARSSSSSSTTAGSGGGAAGGAGGAPRYVLDAHAMRVAARHFSHGGA